MKFLRSGWLMGGVQLVFVVGVLAIAFMLVTALSNIQDNRAPVTGEILGEKAIAVTVTQPRQAAFTPVLELNGVVEAQVETTIASQVGGQVVYVSETFKPGEEVSKGELLFRIDPVDYQLNVEAAMAEIAGAESALQQLETEAGLAIEEWTALYPGEPIPDLAARKPQIAAAKAQLQAAKANHKKAELALSRTRVYAPDTMRILSAQVSLGQLVAPNQTMGAGFPLDALEISVPVSAEEGETLSPVVGRTVKISKTDGVALGLNGMVVRKNAERDARTRLGTLYVKPETSDGLLIGDFVSVAIAGDAIPDAMFVPQTAFSRRDEVWVVANGRLVPRSVRRVAETDSDIIVRQFHTAEGLVVKPPISAYEGMEVTMRDGASE